MITLTEAVVQEITDNAARWFVPLRDAAHRWMIDTQPRLACWLAQCSHESAGFTRLVENLNYSASGLLRTWPRRFSIQLAEDCAYNGEKIAAVVYQNRMGNNMPGDGWKFRGRGLLQITGRENYDLCGVALELPLTQTPDLLLRPEHAASSAGWYWYSHDLNEYADAMNFAGIVKKINGGLIGMQSRLDKLRQINDALKMLA
jgi:putative chitinase